MPVQFNVGAYGMSVSYGPHSTHEQNAKRMHSLIISFKKSDFLRMLLPDLIKRLNRMLNEKLKIDTVFKTWFICRVLGMTSPSF